MPKCKDSLPFENKTDALLYHYKWIILIIIFRTKSGDNIFIEWYI